MFKNYLKIAWRQIRRNKLFSSLNIFGLASSMAVCLLLILILMDQYSYDSFHTHGDQLYRVISAKSSGTVHPNRATMATAPLSLAQPLAADYGFVEQTTRLLPLDGVFRKAGKELPEAENGLGVDPTFLNMLSFGWVKGNATTALASPQSIVLTEETAAKFFPNQNPIGEQLSLDAVGEMTVTGVIPNP
ncbi:MAG: ABC transporter permease, partial [Bacteroidota bacterium]